MTLLGDRTVEINGHADPVPLTEAVPLVLTQIEEWRQSPGIACIEEICDAESILMAIYVALQEAAK